MNNKFTLIFGDSCEKLKGLPDESVDCCITSPPYYGLRDYGTGTWVGGDPNCPHYRTSKINENNQTGHKGMSDKGEAVGDAIYKSVCPMCGAVRVDKQIGLEETPEEYIEKLVDVFREVKRILKQDGTLWVNIGDTYNSSSRTTSPEQYLQGSNKGSYSGAVLGRKTIDSCKQKDLIGIPWMLAFALRNDGWYLRQDIIWHKLNPMPESVKDRFTKSHEYIFLLSKSSKYYFDIDAVMEKSVTYREKNKYHNLFGAAEQEKKEYRLKHKRDVWDIGINSSSVGHYATYPTEIVENCILSGCKPNGVVLDPFNGSGTTGIVANELERDYIGVELSKKYFDLTKERFDSTSNNCKFIINYGSENTEDMFLAISNIILRTNFTVADVICWKKKSAIPNNVSSNKLTRIWEFVFVISRKSEFNTFQCNKRVTSTRNSGQNMYENVFNFIEAPNNDGSCSLNKATYSTDLCEQLLNIYSKDGDSVYDPFMGTGTTAVACKRMGLDCYGSEISENQVKFAINRLDGNDVYSFKDSKNIRRAKSLFDA